MMNLIDIKQALTLTADEFVGLPPHIAAFCALMVPNNTQALELILNEIEAQGSTKHYGYVASLGFSIAMGNQDAELIKNFLVEVEQLSGRVFFSPSRVPRFEIDGVSLLGVAVGLAHLKTPEEKTKWLLNLLISSEQALKDDDWEKSLVKSAAMVLTNEVWSSIPDEMIRVAIPYALNKNPDSSHRQAAWEVASVLGTGDDPVRLSVKRAVFDYCSSILAALPINGASVSELITLLTNVSESMSHWTFETKTRVKGSAICKWHINHEYHVQNLLWTILHPIFPDLVDEESVPKVGHVTSRYDLGIPSLRTIIEVKFMRKSGQAACKKITEEIAADSALYLTPDTKYERIIVFIWDDCRQTEEYHVLKRGLESLNGIEKVIFLPRPNRMERI